MKVHRLFTTFLCLFTLTAIGQPGTPNTDVSTPFFVPTENIGYYSLAGKSIPVHVLQYGDRTNLVCINLHSNEDASVKAAMSILEKTGGTLIRIENRGQRVIRFKLKGITYAFDPNRMFSSEGIQQTLRENSRVQAAAAAEIEKFAAHILDKLTDTAACVVALHNNTEGAYSIRTYLEGGQRQSDAKAVYANENEDPDDIILTTDSLLYQAMSDQGYNSIWQDNERVKKDGSLSVHFGIIGRRYINIETQHGKVEQYAAMLEKLIAILDEEKKLPELQ
ncbi:MAG: hypothetical protein NTW29_02415 [Bacteroidetes bacterium]|nr:hypothetical protein [Bacteroidota bacterium]